MKKITYALLVFLVACSNKNTTVKKDTPSDSIPPTQDTVKTDQAVDTTSLLDYSAEVLKAIKEKDVEKMAGYIHPAEGIRFSPYIAVDTTSDITMSAQEFRDQWTKNANKKINWGPYSAGEEDIKMTIGQYFKKFVYDLDFLGVKKPIVNDIETRGTMINRIPDVYPGLDCVEYHIPGVDPQFDGMDWRSLILVYKTYEGKRYLVGIVHSEWTT
jgi:hypothetical protein